jgi:hypothetical protein
VLGYRVTLTKEEDGELEAMTRRGQIQTRRFIHTRAVLLCDTGADGPAWHVPDVAKALGLNSRTIANIKKRFVENRLEAALGRKTREKLPREIVLTRHLMHINTGHLSIENQGRVTVLPSMILAGARRLRDLRLIS